MKAARKMIEELMPLSDIEPGKSIGVASDQAEAEAILERNGIEYQSSSSKDGQMVWMNNGKMVGRWEQDTGLVWRYDDAFSPGPGEGGAAA